jgi:tetratricopeptide (TPR) repeat protein
MTRRPQRRPSLWRITLLVALISVGLYINQVVVPATPPLFMPTVTPTKSPESFVNQADQLYKAGKINLAMDAYKEAINSDPNNPSNYVDLARLQVFAGQYDDAILNAQNALIQSPDNAMAHAIQGWALGFQEKYGAAEIEIKKALELDPNNPYTHAYYAEILINQNDYTQYDKAAEESKKALELGPNLLEPHRARGIVLLNTQNVEQAVEEFNTAIAINKNIANLHLYLGVAYKALQKFDLAEEALLAAYALNPTDTVALTELSRSYFGDGRFAQAAQYAEEAVKVSPADPRLHGNLGIVYYKLEKYDKAIPELALAVHGGTTADGVAVEGIPLDYGRVEEYYWYYGFSLARSGRCGEATPIFKALLTGVPNDEVAVFNATEGLNACEQASKGPLPTSTPVPDLTGTPEALTPTP